MSILPPSHLDHLCLKKSTHNLPYHLQVLLHSGIPSFKTALYLTNHPSGIRVNLNFSCTHIQNSPQFSKQVFILGFVVRSPKTQPERMFQSYPFQSDDNNSNASSRYTGHAVHEYLPRVKVHMTNHFHLLPQGKFCNKIGKNLVLHRASWLVPNVKGAKSSPPFSYSTREVRSLQQRLQRIFS